MKSPPDKSFKHILQEISAQKVTIRPTTPQSLKPFILLHDPLNMRIYSTIPPIPPPPPPPHQSLFLTPKRSSQKRDPWPREQALEVHSHILRLRTHPRQVREFTAKTSQFFIFRTVLVSEGREAEAWYVLRTGGGGGLGKGDDAGGLENISRIGRERCMEVWKKMSLLDTLDSDGE
jgi:hypothetical protein